jgi:hypothetical protein
MPKADESRVLFIVELLPRVMAAVAAAFVWSKAGASNGLYQKAERGQGQYVN